MKRKKLIISIIVSLVFLNILLVTPFGKRLTAMCINQFNNGVSFVIDKFNDVSSYFKSVSRANKNAALLEQEKAIQDQQLNDLQSEIDALNSDNEALRRQLVGNEQTVASTSAYGVNTSVINGRIINRNVNQWNDRVTVSFDDMTNVVDGAPIINEGILVGFVVSVNGQDADVQLLSLENTNLNIPIMVIDNGREINCIIRRYQASTNEFLIEPLSETDLINNGANVYTNGFQASVAKGIKVGSISGPVQNDETGQNLYRVKVPIQFSNVRYLGVVVNA